jgi:hypothetical protein
MNSIVIGAIRIPAPKPVPEPNRCNLEPLKPERPKTTPYLVLAQGRQTLQVVWLGLVDFRLPTRHRGGGLHSIGLSGRAGAYAFLAMLSPPPLLPTHRPASLV